MSSQDSLLLQYNQDGTQFNKVKAIGVEVQTAIISVSNNYNVEEDQPTVIQGKKNNIINAIDIDWNAADVNLINNSASINTSGQMLKLYADSINTSYSLANSAKSRADAAYELALSGSGDGPTTEDIINIINDNLSLNGSQYVSVSSRSFSDRLQYYFTLTDDTINKLNNSVTGIKGSNSNTGYLTGQVQLTGGQYYTGSNFIPILASNDTDNNNIVLSVQREHLNAWLDESLNERGISEGVEYTGDNTYINVDNSVISLNEDAILSYLKTTELNKNYTRGIGIDINNNIISTKFNCTKGIGTNNAVDDARNLFIVLAGKNSYLKFVDDNSALAVDIDAVKAYIGNSGQGQTITIDSELSSTSTNPLQNKIINNQISSIYNQISSINTNLNNNYVKVDGNTAGTLAVIDINGKTVNASNATTDGTDIYISSDRRLKDNILDITEGEVERLFESESGNMHYFEWKENHKPSFGFIAQELIHFAPEAVTSDSEYMQVNYNAALTKTCAALFKKIKQLEERIKILEGES